MSSLYLWLKALHVLAATVWLGGAVTVFAVNAHFARKRDAGLRGPGAMMSDFVGSKLIAPAGGITLLTGLVAVWVGRLSMQLWLWWGLGVALIVLGFGGTLLRLGFARLSLALHQPEPAVAEIAQLGGRLRRLTLLAVALLLSAVLVMVLKPAP